MSGAEPVTPYLPVHVLCSEPIKPVLRPVTCIPQADVTGWRSKAPLLCGGTGAMRSPRLWASMARSHLLSAGRTRRQAGCKVRPERQPPSPARRKIWVKRSACRLQADSVCKALALEAAARYAVASKMGGVQVMGKRVIHRPEVD
jgi:hypothetical protein